MPLKLSAAAAASQGARPYQEDTSAIWRPSADSDGDGPLLAVVADGMGGHVSGEVASQLACQAFVDTFSAGEGGVRARLEQSLLAANDAIANAISERPELNGMGCTLVAAYVDDRGLWHVSVGDSLLLLLRDEVLRGLNENHSFGAVLDQQVEAGLITAEDAASNPRRNSLRSALTGERIALVDLPDTPSPVKAGDCVVLASDGLDTLNGHEIADLVVGHSSVDADSVAALLINAVDAHGLPNQDNTTVVALRVEEGAVDATNTVQWPAGRVADADDVNTTITVAPAQRIPAVGTPTKKGRSFLVPALFFFGVVAASLAWLFLWANDQKSAPSGEPEKAVSGDAKPKTGEKPKSGPPPKTAEPAKGKKSAPTPPPKDSAPAKQAGAPGSGGSDAGSAGDAGPGKGDAPPPGSVKPKAEAGPKPKAKAKKPKPKATKPKSKEKAKPAKQGKEQKDSSRLPSPGSQQGRRFAERRGVLPDDEDLERRGRRLLLPYPQARTQ